MVNMTGAIKLAAIGIALSLCVSVNAMADILVIDDERVEREALAYRDFNLKTNQIREAIVTLRQNLARGGMFEQQLAELEKQKAILGNDVYEERRQTLAQQYETQSQQLERLETAFDQLREEAQTQVERARQPVVHSIIKQRGAKVMMVKRWVIGMAQGVDVTTEFIEQLNAQLPTVSLPLLEQ